MRDYKSVRIGLEVIICTTMVNTQAYRQLLTMTLLGVLSVPFLFEAVPSHTWSLLVAVCALSTLRRRWCRQPVYQLSVKAKFHWDQFLVTSS